MSTSPSPDHSASPSLTAEGEWRRLDPRTVLASALLFFVVVLGVGIVVAAGLLFSGVGPGWTLFWVGGGAAVLTVLIIVTELIRLATTRYRLGEERIERRMQFLGTSTTTLSRERIRNVELAADLAQRWLGIVEVRLATAEGSGERFKLQALDRTVAEQLREELLGDRAGAETGTLATIDWSWLRFAPVSLATGAIGLAAYGLLLQVLDWFSAVPLLITWLLETTAGLPVVVLVFLLLILALAIGTIATLALYVEEWWQYRLGRHPDGSLDLRRGLVTSRSTVFDGDRLRGVTVHEPWGLRQVGGARLDVIAVGVKATPGSEHRETQSSAVVPPAPRQLSRDVAAAVLGTEPPDDLDAHPAAARHKRFLRATAGIVGLGVLAGVPALVWPGLWWIPAFVVPVGVAVILLLAVDNVRGLGHGITPTHVILRKGSLLRRTDVLEREGLLGWNLTRSPFQRRAGLGTLTATSAGGSGAFRLPDVSPDQARTLMATVGPVWDHLRTDTASRED